MSREFGRNRRIAEQMRRNLSEIVRREVKDPRLQFMTITDIEVSGDLSHANIFFSLLDPKQDPQAASEALQRAAGFIRKQLGHGMRIRQVPQLHFMHDESLARGARLTALIDDAVSRDREAAEDD